MTSRILTNKVLSFLGIKGIDPKQLGMLCVQNVTVEAGATLIKKRFLPSLKTDFLFPSKREIQERQT